MSNQTDKFFNEVLGHAEELVSRHEEILTQIELGRMKWRTIRPTDRYITKLWPLEMLLAKYGAIVLRDDFWEDISRVLGIGKRQRLQIRNYSLRYMREIIHRQRKEKMQKEWQRRL